MSAPRVLVLRAPGINCERETFHAFELAGAAPELVHVSKLLAEPDRLGKFAILAIPGGFAYGDDIAAGRILAQEMRRGLGEQLTAFIDRGGLAIGICNGFQVLARMGMLPRTGEGMREEVSLTFNLSNHYECRWVTVRSRVNRCVFLEEGLTLRCPAAHGEGRLITKGEGFTQKLMDEGYCAFVYTDAHGRATTRYPDNPNGSPLGVAGLTDRTGRVLGLMPHPDRAYLPHHMPDWRHNGLREEGEGMVLFRNMVRVAAEEG